MLSKRERICSEAIDELRRYLDFEQGWDGYDGLSFREDTVECAERIVQQLCSRFTFSIAELTEIVPGPISDGRIDVYAVADGRSATYTVDPGTSRIAERDAKGRLRRTDEAWVDGSIGWQARLACRRSLARSKRELRS